MMVGSVICWHRRSGGGVPPDPCFRASSSAAPGSSLSPLSWPILLWFIAKLTQVASELASGALRVGHIFTCLFVLSLTFFCLRNCGVAIVFSSWVALHGSCVSGHVKCFSLVGATCSGLQAVNLGASCTGFRGCGRGFSGLWPSHCRPSGHSVRPPSGPSRWAVAKVPLLGNNL